jgi:hypothetical protein
MSGLTTGVAGAIAVVLISGAAQFAMGRDLSPVADQLPPTKQASSGSPTLDDTVAINRAAKTDRAVGPWGSPALLQTISLELNGDTVVLMRVPVAVVAPSAASSPAKPLARRPMVACEPVVSVLTEVARRLQPGRCVT